MAFRNNLRDEAPRAYDLIGGVDRRHVAWSERFRQRLEKLPPSLGLTIIVSVAVGLWGGALAGVLIGIAGDGSLMSLIVGVPIITCCAVVAAHLVPPRIMELRE